MEQFIEFVPGAKFASTGAATSDDIETFKDCGYLLKKDELVVDIDHLPKTAIKKLLEYFDIETQTVWTDRGAHLYFAKDGRAPAQGICKLGFAVEIKTASNSPNGVTIRRDGKTRKIDNWGVREEFPDIFRTSKKYQALEGLGESDGRNNKLFAHRGALGNCDDLPKILDFINNYVFAEPLDQKEFETVTRDNPALNAGAEESVLADEIIRDHKCTGWNDSLWFWSAKDNRYVTGIKDLRRAVYKYCSGKKTQFVDEVIKQIEYRCPLEPDDAVFKIRLKNGYLDRGKFYPIQPTGFTPYFIDIEYDPKAEAYPLVDEYLLKLTSREGATDEDIEDYRKILLEVLAYGLVVDHEKVRKLCKFFLFHGDGGNGKGTLCQIIMRIYGSENCSALSITDLEDRTYIVDMIGKLINIGDDIEGKPITKTQFKRIKNITSGDVIQTRGMYKSSEAVRITTKLIYTSNEDIKTYDKGRALERRMYWMPMFNQLENAGDQLISDLTCPKALKYWLRLMVEAYQRLYKSGWTNSKICNDYNSDYHKHNDLSIMFLEEVGIDSLIGKTMNEIEEAYAEWNTDDDRKFSRKSFKNTAWEKYQAGIGVVYTDGSSKRVLLKQSETKQSVKPNFK